MKDIFNFPLTKESELVIHKIVKEMVAYLGQISIFCYVLLKKATQMKHIQINENRAP